MICNLPVGLSVGVVTVFPLLSSWFLLLQLSSSFLVRVTPSSTTEFFSCCWPCTLATAELFSSEQSISECLAHLSLLRCIRCESFWRGFSRQNHYILILYSERVWDATWCRVQWAAQTGHVYPRCACVCVFTARGLLHVPEVVVAVKMRRVEEIRKEETHCRWLHCWLVGQCLPTLSLLLSFFLLSSSILYSPPSFSFLLFVLFPHLLSPLLSTPLCPILMW